MSTSASRPWLPSVSSHRGTARARTSSMWSLQGFKSLVPAVTPEDINEAVGIALEHQYMFKRRTSPWEATSWDDNELMNFSVELQHIDRVYDFNGNEHEIFDDYHDDDGDIYYDCWYYLMVRVQHQGRPLFVLMTASRDCVGPRFIGRGKLFVTANANVYFNVAVSKGDPKGGAILASLLEDGYVITLVARKPKPCKVKLWDGVPQERRRRTSPFRLKVLCQEAVRANQPRLAHYPAELPQTLARSVDEFIIVRDAMDKYDEPNWW